MPLESARCILVAPLLAEPAAMAALLGSERIRVAPESVRFSSRDGAPATVIPGEALHAGALSCFLGLVRTAVRTTFLHGISTDLAAVVDAVPNA